MILGIVIGIFIGGCVGVVVMAIVQMAKEDEPSDIIEEDTEDKSERNGGGEMITAVKRYGGYVREREKEKIPEAVQLIGQQMGQMISQICKEEKVKFLSVNFPIVNKAEGAYDYTVGYTVTVEALLEGDEFTISPAYCVVF